MNPSTGSAGTNDLIRKVGEIRAALARPARRQSGEGPRGPAQVPVHPVILPAPLAEPSVAAGGLHEYWQILVRRKMAVLLAALVGALATFLLSLPQQPVYRARVSLEIQSLNENFLNMRDLDPTVTPANFSSESYLETQTKILQSDSLLDRVVAKLGLERRPEFTYRPSRVAVWLQRFRLPMAKPVPAREYSRQVARGSLSVRSSRTSRIVEILYDSSDPQLAADFANTLANEFIEQNVEVRWNASKRTGEWLGRQLGDVKEKLENSEHRLQAYARASQLVWTSEKDSVAEGKLRQLQEELSRANADRVAKQSQYEIAATSAPDSLPAVLDSSVLRDLQIKLADLRRELAQLRPSYKPAHYKVQQVQAQIEEVEGALRKERASVMNRIRNDYQAALRRERLLLSAYEGQTKLVSEQAEKAIQYHILKREVETNRQLYESMLQKLKEAGIASAMRASNVRIVDAASPPATPYKPNPVQNAALGVMAGLALGVGLVLVREHGNRMRTAADRSIKVPGDSPGYLQVPELGVIPCGSAGSEKNRRFGGGLARFCGLHGDGEVPRGVELATWEKPASVVAESFRATLTSVLFSSRSGNGARLLVVTSPSPGEGKSTVASNLAIALAEIHPRVLLIDGDLRRSRLHRLYGVDNSRGLSDLLRASGAPRDTASRVLIRETKVPHLYLLPSGSGGAAVSHLFHSARVRELLQALGREFEAVVIDAPPMMHIADARLLGRLADGVILVFRSGVTTREVALTARQCFAEDGTPVLGTILNDWDPEAAGPPYAGAYYDYRYFDPQLRASGRNQT